MPEIFYILLTVAFALQSDYLVFRFAIEKVNLFTLDVLKNESRYDKLE